MAAQEIPPASLADFGPLGHVNTMNANHLAALLLLTAVALAAPALADPIVSTDGLMPICELDGLDGDGQADHVGRVWVNVDVLDQDGQPCLT
jgi:hypothetical protein